MKIAASTLPAPGVFLQIEEAGGAFDICERIKGLLVVPVEDPPTGGLPPQDAAQFARVPLTHPEEVDHLIIDIIQDFDFRSWLVKEHLRASSKRLYVCRMGRDEGDQLLGDPTFASDVGQRSNHGFRATLTLTVKGGSWH